MPSSWLQLSLHADPAAFDALSNFLIERGSPGVVIKRNEIQAYFAHSPHDAAIRADVRRFARAIHGLYPRGADARMRWRLLKDRNWNSAWRRFFRPQKIGDTFWVTPPWAAPPENLERHVIIIEPGMAFGTGTHATTRGCMEFIEKVAPTLRARSLRALDVGTGSGILAIALVKSGAKRVWALDNDPVALKVARENLRLNGVHKQVRLAGSKLNQIKTKFPVVVANITSETILELVSALRNKVAPGGFLILSGILNPRANDVVRRFTLAGFCVAACKREKEWATLLLRRARP